MRAAVVVAILATLGSLSACRKGGETCDKFVERTMSCPDEGRDGMTGDERSQLKTMLGGMCEAAFSEETAGATGEQKKMMLEMYATVRKKAACVAKASDCAAAKACDAIE